MKFVVFYAGSQWVFKGTRGAQAGRPPASAALHTALALSNSASFLLASAGGHVTLYNLETAKVCRPLILMSCVWGMLWA